MTNFDIYHTIYLSVIRSLSRLSPIIAHARIPHYRPKCSRDSKRPTPSNDAELMSCRKINRFLAECHVLPSCLGAVVNQRHLIRICPFPVPYSSVQYVNFWSLRKPGVTCQLFRSYRRPAVSPAIINAGTTAITTPNAFNDGGKVL